MHAGASRAKTLEWTNVTHRKETREGGHASTPRGAPTKPGLENTQKEKQKRGVCPLILFWPNDVLPSTWAEAFASITQMPHASGMHVCMQLHLRQILVKDVNEHVIIARMHCCLCLCEEVEIEDVIVDVPPVSN